MKTVFAVAVCLVTVAGCAEPPSDSVIAAVAESCKSRNERVEVIYTLGGGYSIKCDKEK